MDSKKSASLHTGKQTGLARSEKAASLFQPDTLLSEQFFDVCGRKTLFEPEKRLMLAILEDAINCFQDNHRAQGGKNRQLFDRARAWIFGMGDWVFGFENICGALGFDPEYIRKGLVRWREKELSKHPSAPLWQEPKKASEINSSAPSIG